MRFSQEMEKVNEIVVSFNHYLILPQIFSQCTLGIVRLPLSCGRGGRFYPQGKAAQRGLLGKYFGCVRYVYNQALATKYQVYCWSRQRQQQEVKIRWQFTLNRPAKPGRWSSAW